MNQNLYGQSEPSSLSRGLLTDSKQFCVTSSIRHIWNLHSTRTRPVYHRASRSGRKLGSPVPSEKTPGSFQDTSPAEPSPHTEVLKLRDKPDAEKPRQSKQDTSQNEENELRIRSGTCSQCDQPVTGTQNRDDSQKAGTG